MDGKPEKAVHIVDRERAAKINRKVTKKVFKKQDEWSFVPKFYIDAVKLMSNILFIPVVLFIAMLEGVRAGFIKGMEKALAMYRLG